MKCDRKKLELWQRRLSANETAYKAQSEKMDERERLYDGAPDITPFVVGEQTISTPHVRNIVSELVEAQVSSSIPAPKVSPRRKEDEGRAKLIEDMLREELDRMHFEELNDQQERTVPIQGGGLYLVEWDSTQRTHNTVGEVSISLIHPKQVIPQAGVYTGIEDMDYIILKIPQTKDYIQRRYGVDVSDEREDEPEIRGEGESPADDVVTQYVAYYRNNNGGIGLYSWVGDTQLEDLEDYQARRLRHCAKCGAKEPPPGTVQQTPPTKDGTPRDVSEGNYDEYDEREIGEGNRKNVCPYCGSTQWREETEDFEEVLTTIARTYGDPIEPFTVSLDPDGNETIERTKLPYYKPDIYPVVLQKNVSVYGRFLGGSDVDQIRTQQNTTNRLEAKMLDKVVSAGSYLTLPPDARLEAGPGEMKIFRPENMADKEMIDVVTVEGDISQDAALLAQTYEEARQIIGITDSFQGRRDPTATSGKAKEFSAAQAAGRMESKRTMKNAAYERLFEAIFKFKLAYADEPRPVAYFDSHGQRQYSVFNRYDFLERDSAGEWYWDDQFIFSCDTSSPLAANREAMWQETRMNFQSGAFGDPRLIDTLILFWTKMEMLHYPGAGETKAYLEERRQTEAAAAEAQAREKAELMRIQAAIEGGRVPVGTLDTQSTPTDVIR